MQRKKEKIVEQVFEADFIKECMPSRLLADFAFLKQIKFHSLILCESKERKYRGRRLVLLPRHMKVLLNGAKRLLTRERKASTKERRGLQKEVEKQENLYVVLQNEYAALQNKYEVLREVNEQLMRNIEDKSLKECNRPKGPSGYSHVFDDAAPQLHGQPYQGGAPSLGKK